MTKYTGPTKRIDVIQDAAGKVTALWFGCLLLPFDVNRNTGVSSSMYSPDAPETQKTVNANRVIRSVEYDWDTKIEEEIDNYCKLLERMNGYNDHYIAAIRFHDFVVPEYESPFAPYDMRVSVGCDETGHQDL